MKSICELKYLFILFAMVLLIVFTANLFASEPLKSSDLSQVNWDEEDGKVEENTAETSWEDDDTEEKAVGETSANLEALEKIEHKERKIQISGFFFFVFYIMGSVLTAYFTRNRKIAVHSPPELLILLHSVWPLEILLLSIFGKKVR